MVWSYLEVKWQFSNRRAKEKVPFSRRGLVSYAKIAEITPIVDILMLLVQTAESSNCEG